MTRFTRMNRTARKPDNRRHCRRHCRRLWSGRSAGRLCLLLLVCAGLLPAHAAQAQAGPADPGGPADPAGQASGPLQIVQEQGGVRILWQAAQPTSLEASPLPVQPYQGFDLPLALVLLRLPPDAQEIVLEVRSGVSAELNPNLLRAAEAATPPVLNEDVPLDLNPAPESALPVAPLSTLRMGRVDGDSRARARLQPDRRRGQRRLLGLGAGCLHPRRAAACARGNVRRRRRPARRCPGPGDDRRLCLCGRGGAGRLRGAGRRFPVYAAGFCAGAAIGAADGAAGAAPRRHQGCTGKGALDALRRAGRHPCRRRGASLLCAAARRPLEHDRRLSADA